MVIQKNNNNPKFNHQNNENETKQENPPDCEAFPLSGIDCRTSLPRPEQLGAAERISASPPSKLSIEELFKHGRN